jgi:hypothetical protein
MRRHQPPPYSISCNTCANVSGRAVAHVCAITCVKQPGLQRDAGSIMLEELRLSRLGKGN